MRAPGKQPEIAPEMYKYGNTGRTCGKVTELAGEVVEFFIIVLVVICFKLMVVAVCTS